MAHIEERTGADGKTKYRVQIRLLGFPQQTATFDRKTDAKRWAQKTEAAMKEGRYFKAAEAKKKTITMMIDKYISEELPKKPKNAHNTNAQLLWWKEKIGYCLLADITPALIGEHRVNFCKEERQEEQFDPPLPLFVTYRLYRMHSQSPLRNGGGSKIIHYAK